MSAGRRDFSKVASAMWHSKRFRSLTDSGKIAFIYLLTNSHVTSAGCYALPDGYACTDLGWPIEEYHASRDELVSAGMIDHDADHQEVLIERWFKHNAPMNLKMAQGTETCINAIESHRLHDKTLKAFDVFSELISQWRQKATDAAAEKAAEKAAETGQDPRIAALDQKRQERLARAAGGQ